MPNRIRQRLARTHTRPAPPRLCLLPIGLLLFLMAPAMAQEPAPEGRQPVMPETGHAGESPTGLAALVKEVEENNPQIVAARHAWRAATQVPSQVSTLPDPEVTVQQLNVGSPRPFAGFSNSDFAYLGFGISQGFPYPGKLRLQGEIAQSEALAAREQAETVRRTMVRELKETYFEVAYVQQTLAVLDRDQKLLDQIGRVAEARYRVGQGNQEEVLKAQLQRTKLLSEVTMHHQHMDSLEVRLKQILNRAPGSPDIVAEDLVTTPFPYSSDELLARVRKDNPEVTGEQEMVKRQSLQVELAHKDFYPDFNVQYLWQHTAEQFRDYYMLTFGVRIPIYRSRKQRPELAQAVEELNRSRREYESRVQGAYFEVQDQFLQAQAAEQLLKIYHDGLIPQATATFQAALAAYQSNREDFETLLSSLIDVLQLDEEYWRTLFEHEKALARLEELTGAALH